MNITDKTLYKDCFMFIKHEHIEQIKEKVSDEDLQGYEAIVSLNLGDFLRLIKGDETIILDLFFKGNVNFTLYEFCKRIKWLENEAKKIQSIFDSMKLKHTDEEKRASNGVQFLPFELEIQAFAIEKFHLKSFEEAEKCRTSDVLVMKKREVANAKYERNLRTIYGNKK